MTGKISIRPILNVYVLGLVFCAREMGSIRFLCGDSGGIYSGGDPVFARYAEIEGKRSRADE